MNAGMIKQTIRRNAGVGGDLHRWNCLASACLLYRAGGATTLRRTPTCYWRYARWWNSPGCSGPFTSSSGDLRDSSRQNYRVATFHAVGAFSSTTLPEPATTVSYHKISFPSLSYKGIHSFRRLTTTGTHRHLYLAVWAENDLAFRVRV